MFKSVHTPSTTAPIIATGEMWGNHCEKWYGERHYGGALPRNVLSNMQGTFFRNDGSPTIFYAGEDTDFIFGLNANYGAIEGHNPDIGIWQWIPQGLCYDLIDNRNDGAIPIIDNVNGFTINQCFAALQSDVRSIPEFRNRMILQNPNNQQAQIIELFQEYDY